MIDRPADNAISMAEVLEASSNAAELAADRSGLYWIESLPAENGRSTILWMPDPDQPQHVVDCTPAAKVRSRLHSYGGGAFAVLDGWLVWLDAETNCLWARSPEQAEYRLAEVAEDTTFGALSLGWLSGRPDPLLFAVRERPVHDEHSISELVVTDLATGIVQTLPVPQPWAAADFVTCPVLGPSGRLAWTQWNQPAMAWDSSCLLVAELSWDGNCYALSTPILVAGGTASEAASDDAGIAVQRPQWCADGSLRYLSDIDGWYQVHAWHPTSGSRRCLTPASYDHDLPQWTADNASHAMLTDGQLFAAPIIAGRAELRRYRAGSAVRIDLPISSVAALSARDDQAFALVEFPDRPGALISISADGQVRELRRFGQQMDAALISRPRTIWGTSDSGPVHGWFYPARNQAAGGPAPLLVVVHGGPTDMRTDAWHPSTQYWAQRGIGVLEINYSGSSGFGRSYRNRLAGNWGILDVQDVIQLTNQVLGEGLADPRRVAVMGSSAGGFTVLNALSQSELFVGGISKYGIADLTKLVGGPKFEARYLDSLIGPWPQAADRYRQRSPLQHVAQINSPLLLLQGSADPIVPPDQAAAMAAAARDSGVEVELVIFDGEAHGFRSSDAQQQALACQQRFLSRIFGMPLS